MFAVGLPEASLVRMWRVACLQEGTLGWSYSLDVQNHRDKNDGDNDDDDNDNGYKIGLPVMGVIGMDPLFSGCLGSVRQKSQPIEQPCDQWHYEGDDNGDDIDDDNGVDNDDGDDEE